MVAIENSPFEELASAPTSPSSGQQKLYPDTTAHKFNHVNSSGEVWKIADERAVTANSGAAYAIDLSKGNVFYITLTADCTFTFTNPSSLVSFTLYLIQDGTGGHATTLPTVLWSGGVAPTLVTTAGAKNVLVFISPNGGANYFGGAFGLGFA